MIFGYAVVSCLVVNDAVKVAMIKWRVPNAVANETVTKAGDLTPQIAARAYEPYEPPTPPEDELSPMGARTDSTQPAWSTWV